VARWDLIVIQQRMAVHVKAIEDHVAQVAGKFPVPWAQPRLEGLEIRVPFVADRDDFAVDQNGHRKLSERASDSAK
jgi:hypothetical protein